MRVPGWKAKRLNSAVAGVTVLSCALVAVLAGCGSADAQGSPLDGVTDPPGDEASAAPGNDATADGGDADGSGSDSNAEGPTEFPEVEVPQYTTDLDLSPEQIIEADEVLKTVELEAWLSNQTFQTGEFNNELAHQIMTDGEVKSFRDDAKPVFTEGIRQVNDTEHQNYELVSLGNTKSQGIEAAVEVCVDDSKTRFIKPDGSNYFDNPGTASQINYSLKKDQGRWKIAERYLVSDSCL